MANSNGIITAPISIADVKAVIGSSSNDLGTLCRYGEDDYHYGLGDGDTLGINMWAKYKPIAMWKTASSGVLVLNDTLKGGTGSDKNNVTAAGTHRKGNRFGLKVPYTGDLRDANITYKQATNGQLGDLAALYEDNAAAYGPFDWTYPVPQGGSAQPYRLSDFNGYNHHAEPINVDFNPNDAYAETMDEQLINTVATQQMDFGLAWPNAAGSITWNEMLAALNSSAGSWKFCIEVYDNSTPISGSPSKKIGLSNSAGNRVAPIKVFMSSTAVNLSGTPQYAEMTATVNFNDSAMTANNRKHFTFVMGFKHFDGGGTCDGAVLPPFNPMRRISTDFNFPYNMRFYAIGLVPTNGTFRWYKKDVPADLTAIRNGFETSSSTLWMWFKVNPGSSSLTLENSNLAQRGIGSWSSQGEGIQYGKTKLCDSNGQTGDTSKTIAANTETDVYLKCEDIMQNGVGTDFYAYFRRAGQVTEMGNIMVRIVKKS